MADLGLVVTAEQAEDLYRACKGLVRRAGPEAQLWADDQEATIEDLGCGCPACVSGRRSGETKRSCGRERPGQPDGGAS